MEADKSIPEWILYIFHLQVAIMARREGILITSLMNIGSIPWSEIAYPIFTVKTSNTSWALRLTF